MYSYDTSSEALADLKERGYEYDFNLQEESVVCDALGGKWPKEEIRVNEFYRFEGISDPEDEEILYAIETVDGLKGVFIDGYGTYYGGDEARLLQHLQLNAIK